ncbi:MAG: hypothetical protein HYY54_03625, partial [candidate division NC10 bacterium]|nr:hypothetical protein [candidate division NC10 bacterium]
LVREIIRQRRRDLWICAEFTLHETALLTGAGCCARIDVGFLGYGGYIGRAVSEGRVRVSEWTNGSLAVRMLAGARGVPFLPVRTLLATDTLVRSGAKVIRDPFTGEPVCLVPGAGLLGPGPEPRGLPLPRSPGRRVWERPDLRDKPLRPRGGHGGEEGHPLHGGGH